MINSLKIQYRLSKKFQPGILGILSRHFRHLNDSFFAASKAALQASWGKIIYYWAQAESPLQFMNYKDIYELLDNLRKRPGLYLGNEAKNSFPALIAFITGVELFNNIGEGEPDYRDLSGWITSRVDGMSKSMPWQWMNTEWGSEQAFFKFFELLDEYRTCKTVCLQRVVFRGQKPTFEPNDRLVESGSLLEVCIGQFAPSKVYYLLKVYTNLHRKEFPFFRSIKAAKKEANSSFGFLKEDWFDV